MNKNWLNPPMNNPARGMDVVRITVALMLAVHGIHGVLIPKNVNGLGGYLDSIGFPFGVALAWAVMIIQITCSAALIFRRLIVPACVGHIVILGVGIGLFHAAAGWFVVGPGQGGVEYSLTLIACLFAVLLAYWPGK